MEIFGGRSLAVALLATTLFMAAGGGADVFSRIVAAKVSEQIGHPVVVVNRPGAGGIVGTEALINAPADGYTIGYDGNPQATHHIVFKQPHFVLSRDTIPVNAGAEYIQGLRVVGGTPEFFAQRIDQEVEVLKRIMTAANMQPIS